MTEFSEHYARLLKQIDAIIADEPDSIANAANISSVLFNNLPQVNWVGFYFIREGELVLGPFQGQVACTRIPVGKGVCGTAIASMQPQRVADVRAFPGHIACDAASLSEVVIPFETTTLAGVLDIDSPVKARFGEAEQSFFEAVTALFISKISRISE
jgi:GAF domain-containing protein